MIHIRNILLLLVIISTRCSPDYHATILGNWYNCSDGTYTEMYINGEYYTSLSVSMRNMRIGTNTIWKYEIAGDTLLYGLPSAVNNSILNRGRIKIISDDHIQMNSFNESTKKESDFYDLYRLRENFKFADVSLMKDSIIRRTMEQEFLRRASGSGCSK